MVTGLACGFGILAVILGLLLFKLIRQIRELERQIRFLEEKQSNGDLVCDVRFGGIGKLTDTLNQVFAQQKQSGSSGSAMKTASPRPIRICPMISARLLPLWMAISSF